MCLQLASGVCKSELTAAGSGCGDVTVYSQHIRLRCSFICLPVPWPVPWPVSSCCLFGLNRLVLVFARTQH